MCNDRYQLERDTHLISKWIHKRCSKKLMYTINKLGVGSWIIYKAMNFLVSIQTLYSPQNICFHYIIDKFSITWIVEILLAQNILETQRLASICDTKWDWNQAQCCLLFFNASRPMHECDDTNLWNLGYKMTYR